ncbi:sporulation histidine kinase inhibitor Sda [Paenibacillus aurantiacus]|uniref:Sporulation histidine kinase inhibitor Sda n=1 Tax=Paenibacillus aurantiacus TaxID=1936118 RepID=A0ABV5KIH1_9BACL
MNRSQSAASVRSFLRHESEDPAFYESYPPAFGVSFIRESDNSPSEPNIYLPMQDKSMLLRPLSDTHLLEVYHEAKAMRLSHEFIALIEQALEQRGISLIDNDNN